MPAYSTGVENLFNAFVNVVKFSYNQKKVSVVLLLTYFLIYIYMHTQINKIYYRKYKRYTIFNAASDTRGSNLKLYSLFPHQYTQFFKTELLLFRINHPITLFQLLIQTISNIILTPTPPVNLIL